MNAEASRVVQDLGGRVCLITGANTGIGAVTARELARAGARVFLACRSRERTVPVVDSIIEETGNGEVEFLHLDLSSFASVKRCAQDFSERGLPLHVLINNAGLAGHRGLTDDGFEMTFGVNHLGHFLLTQLLLERIKESAPARIVVVASKAHFRVDHIDYAAARKPTRSVSGMLEYSTSKLANVLFSCELGRRLEGSGVATYSLHPGVVASDVWRGVPWPIRPLMKAFMISNEEGAQTTLYCATAPELENESGRYYDSCRVRKPNRVVEDRAVAEELWAKSEQFVA